MPGIPVRTPADIPKIVRRAWEAAIESLGGKPMKQTVMLWGPPGVGKSAGVYAAARAIAVENGWELVVDDTQKAMQLAAAGVDVLLLIDVRLQQHDIVDIGGGYIPNMVQRRLEHVPTSLWPTVTAIRVPEETLAKKIGELRARYPEASEEELKVRALEEARMEIAKRLHVIIFLDEINLASEEKQQGVRQLVYAHKIGQEPLPPDTLIVMAGNPPDIGIKTNPMDEALANRVSHYYITAPDAESWASWAASHGVHPAVVAFIKQFPSALFSLPKDWEGGPNQAAYPTPRSWAMVGQKLKSLEEKMGSLIEHGVLSVDAVDEVASSVGSQLAAQFEAFFNTVVAGIANLVDKAFKNPEQLREIMLKIRSGDYLADRGAIEERIKRLRDMNIRVDPSFLRETFMSPETQLTAFTLLVIVRLGDTLAKVCDDAAKIYFNWLRGAKINHKEIAERLPDEDLASVYRAILLWAELAKAESIVGTEMLQAAARRVQHALLDRAAKAAVSGGTRGKEEKGGSLLKVRLLNLSMLFTQKEVAPLVVEAAKSRGIKDANVEKFMQAQKIVSQMLVDRHAFGPLTVTIGRDRGPRKKLSMKGLSKKESSAASDGAAAAES